MKKIQVLAYRVGQPPALEQMEPTLEAQQAFVGGYIEGINITDRLMVICNEEARLLSMPRNRYILDRRGNPLDVVLGNFFFVGRDKDGANVSLTLDEVDQCKSRVRALDAGGEDAQTVS